MPEVRDLLNKHLDPETERSLAIRSLYGQHFTLFTYLDFEWAREVAIKIFPNAEQLLSLWDAAWSTYIKFSGAYDNVFEILRPQYALAVERIVPSSDTSSDSIVERLAAHLITFYWRGIITLGDNLLSRFMTLAPPHARGEALGYVGRSLINSKEEVPVEIKKRLCALWEQRLGEARTSSDRAAFKSELKAFSYWFASGHFDDSWAISQLLEVMDLVGEPGNSYVVIKRLAQIATKLPYDTIRCLEAVLFDRTKSRLYVAALSEVGIILEAALSSLDQRSIDIAIRIINVLSEQGDLRFRSLVSSSSI
jgi:hypothetical protein